MRIFLSILFLLLYFRYSSAQTDTITDGYKKYYYPSGAVSSEGLLKNGKPDGYWKTYFENGALKTEGNRKNYQLDSLWKFFGKNGKLQQTLYYKEGKKNGLKQVFDPDSGFLLSEEPFVNDVREGLVKNYKKGFVYKTIPFIAGKEVGKGYEYAADSTIITITTYKNGFLQREERINRKDAAGRKQGNWKLFFPNLSVKIECRYENDRLDGYYKEYNIKGDLIKTAKYVDGNLQQNASELIMLDTRNEFYENGKIKSSGTYKQGIAEGITKIFDENGKPIDAKIYKGGLLTSQGLMDERGWQQGEWKEFYPTGEIRAQGAYLNGKRTGKWNFFYQNGKKEQTGSYNKNGKPEANWTWYYESGNTLREESFINGLTEGEMREYTDSGKVITRGMYVEGEKEGFWFLEDGDERQEGNYKAGQRTGEWKWFYSNGKTAYKGEFIENLENGKHTIYYDNGRVMQEGKFIMGQKDGKWRKYDTDGTLLYTIEYQNDQEVKFNGNNISFPDTKPDK